MSKNLVIYHDHCVDGFAAAWAAWKFLGAENTIYMPCNYGQVPEPVEEVDENSTVYIVDFSFPRDILQNVCSQVAKVIVLDHHKTAAEALQNWTEEDGKPENLDIVFDMERSGAGITWDWFISEAGDSHTPRPALIDYVEDRDLWRFKLPHSKDVNAYISFIEKTFERYESLSFCSVETMTEYGELLSQQHQRICEEIVPLAREITINGHTGLAANCTGQFASEVGNLLAKKSGTFGGTFFYDSEGTVKWSLRSEGDYDVSEIAKSFGGGGHKNAAGFVLKDLGTSEDGKSNLWSAGE